MSELNNGVPEFNLEGGEKKIEKKAKNFFKRVFVHNIGAKIFALVFSIILWALAVGLSTDLFDKKTEPEGDGTAAVVRTVEQ